MMKIGFLITSTGWGGLEMNTLKLAKSLRNNGFDITIYTQEKSTLFEKANNIVNEIELINRRRKYFDFKTAKEFSTSLKEKNINTIIIFDNKDLDVASWAKRLYFNQLNIIYQQHMQIGINKKKILQTLRFNSINTWISPLEYLKNEVIQRTNFKSKKIKVIPLGLDIHKFTNNQLTKNEARHQLNINPQAPLIGIIGRISQKKGQLFLLESFMKLRKQGLEVELLIFGSPTINDIECQTYYKKLCETIKENELEKVVHLIDHREDVQSFYQSIDIFVLASESETYGMVTIEAMLSKVPIIATKSGGTSEILGNGKFGSLYEYENFEDLSQQLNWTLNNPSEIATITQNAYKEAIDKYSDTHEINEIVKLLNEQK